MDQMNPRVLSNNMLVPYIIAIREEYFRSTFKAVLKYSKGRSRALKRVKINHAHLEFALQDSKSIEGGIADCFSFQRPAHISENFRMIACLSA